MSFSLCPDAKTATKVARKEISKLLLSLGFQNKRADIIQCFSQEYLKEGWTHVTQLHGVGKCAADAYAIFCAGKWYSVVPIDHKLNEYWEFLWKGDAAANGRRISLAKKIIVSLVCFVMDAHIFGKEDYCIISVFCNGCTVFKKFA